MSGRRNGLLAGPLLLLGSLVIGGSSDVFAAEGDADTRPAAETRRTVREIRTVEVDDDIAPPRGRMRDREDDDGVVDRRRGDRGRGPDRGGPSDREWFRDPGYYGYGNFPTVEVHDAVVANARAATARALFRRAENALNASVRKAVRTFEGSADLREAKKTEKDAYESYSIARRRAMQSVLEDPKYRAIMSLRQELTDQINNTKASRSYDERSDKQVTDDVIAMAKLKMNYAADAREMEKLALETSAEAKDAQARFRQAATRVSELKRDFDDALRNDRDLLAARRNLEDARIARLTASAYVSGAVEAANEALDFAYYLNRYSRYQGAGYSDYRDYYPYAYRGRY